MKTKILIAILLLILAIGAVSAADKNMTSDDTTSDEYLTNHLSADNNEESLNENPQGTFSELSELINNDSDTLELDKDYIKDELILEEGISITKSITIDGKGHTLDANFSSRIFNIEASNVTLKNINFKNGYYSISGGAINAKGDNCHIINSTFTNCKTDTIFTEEEGIGGAINSIGNYWSVTNSTFIKCSANTGGAIYTKGKCWNISNSTFNQCSARYYGGAIYTLSSYYINEIKVTSNDWNINCCTFIQCTSYAGGGAIYSNGDNWNIENSFFTKCIASGFSGGAILSTHANCSVKNSSFTNCIAKWDGGAIFFKGKNPRLLDYYFKNNTANKGLNWHSIYNITTGPEIIASNLNTVYNANSYYSIKVYGHEGELANCEKVVVKVNGKTFKTLTAKNGIARFKVTQIPGTYKLSIASLGKTTTKKLTVKHVIALKTVTIKKSAKKLTLQATLKNGKSPIKNKQVTFKFNGKTYKAKTNSKGIAKVTIPKSILSKLKVGKKITYQATYLKDTVKKTVKVLK